MTAAYHEPRSWDEARATLREYAADATVLAAALAAQVVVLGDDGRRRVPVDELLVDAFTTSLAPGELIHSIEIPGRAPTARAVYVKFTLRSVDDYATVSVAAR